MCLLISMSPNLVHLQPSHHIPYFYSLAGAASKSQERIREIAQINYNNSVNGLSGVRLTSSRRCSSTRLMRSHRRTRTAGK